MKSLTIKQAIGGAFGVGVLHLLFVGPLFDWVQTHQTFISRLLGLEGLVCLVSAFLAAGLCAGWKDMRVKKWSESFQGETKWNPFWGWFIGSMIINIVWTAMME